MAALFGILLTIGELLVKLAAMKGTLVPVEPWKPIAPSLFESETDRFWNATDLPCTTRGSNIQTRAGIRGRSSYRWTRFIIQIDKKFDEAEVRAVNNAMWTIQEVIPCIPFDIYPATLVPKADYVSIIKGSNNGCNSFVGRRGGRQIMNLQSPGCMRSRTIMHEILHALGLRHEHQRPDRDQYITIHWNNIRPGSEFAFRKYQNSSSLTSNIPYDVKSIMHYGSSTFSRNRRPTITRKGGGTFRRSRELCQTDILRLKEMYPC